MMMMTTTTRRVRAGARLRILLLVAGLLLAGCGGSRTRASDRSGRQMLGGGMGTGGSVSSRMR